MGSIPPPTSTPIRVWCRACHPDPAGTAAVGGHHGVHGSVPRRQRPTEPGGSAGRGAGLCGASCASRTAQVMGPFDLAVIGTHSARYMKVHRRSARGRRNWCSIARLEAHLSVVGRGILKPMLRPAGAACCPARSVQRDTPTSAGLSCRRHVNTDPGVAPKCRQGVRIQALAQFP